MSISRKSLIAIAAVASLALGSPAGASLQFKATFFEQQTSDAATDTSTDLWILEVLGIGPAVTIKTVEFQLPDAKLATDDIYFDIVPGDAGFDIAGPFTADTAVGTSVPTATVTEGSDSLSLDFTGAGFGDAGDSFSFTLDVDNGNAIIRGFDVLDIFDSLRNTDVKVTYDAGSATDLMATFKLDTHEGQEISFTSNGSPANWFTGVSGTTHLPIIPEPTTCLVWSLLGCSTLLGLRRR